MAAVNRPMQQSSGGGQDSKDALLRVNNFVFRLPQNLSLVENRTHVTFRSQTAVTSSGQVLQVKINSGSAFVAPHTSYITFGLSIGMATAKTWTTPIIGALAAFQSVRLLSRNGTEIYRANDLNLFLSKWLVYTKGADFWEQASSWDGNYPARAAARTNTKDTVYYYSFPLNLLMGVFDAQVLPSHLISGCTLELEIADAYQSFKFAGDPVSAQINIGEFQCHCDCLTLSETAELAIDRVSARNGLEVCFPGIHTSTTTSAATYTELNVQKACSRASFLMTAIRDPDFGTPTADSFKSESVVTRAQTRIGSVFLPNQMADFSKPNFATMYNEIQFGKKSKRLSTDTGSLVVAQQLQKSQILKYSGTSVNSNRQLSHLIEVSNSGAKSYRYTTFLIFDKVARVSLENTIISE